MLLRSAIGNARSRAGFRNATRIRPDCSSSAIGKKLSLSTGQLATCLPAKRSMTAIMRAFGEIHEDAADRTRQLKAFGVRGQGKVENLSVRHRIDLGQTAATITHENSVRRRINTNIIRIFSQIDTA